MDKRIAGAIIRVSTARQLEGSSPEKQLEAMRALAAEQGYELANGYTWQIAESGASRDRVSFRTALDVASAGEISRVYVYSVDRLGRDLLEMLLFLRGISDLGIECWEAERRRRLIWNDFMLQVEGAVAGKERQEIRRRTQDGLKRAVRAGKYSGGIIAYGYQLNHETKKLEIAQDEAAIVRMIFEWCAEERLSCVKIGERLNAMEIPTRYTKDGRKVNVRGKRRSTAGIWRAGRIRHMLRNPAYMGEWHWGKRSKTRKRDDWIPGYCPAIVSRARFRQAGRVLDSLRIYEPGNKKRQYLLHGIIKCAHCDFTYTGAAYSSGKKRKEYRRYYRCNRASSWKKLGLEKCNAKAIRASTVEQVVWEDIKAFVKNPDVAIEHLRAHKAPVDNTLSERLEEVESQLREIKRRERNALRIATESSNVDVKTLDEVLEEIRNSQISLEAYRDDLAARLHAGEDLEQELFNVATRLSRLNKRIDNATYAEMRRAVEELVKEIRVETQTRRGKRVALVTVIYRFDTPEHLNAPEWANTLAADRTVGRAVTLE